MHLILGAGWLQQAMEKYICLNGIPDHILNSSLLLSRSILLMKAEITFSSRYSPGNKFEAL